MSLRAPDVTVGVCPFTTMAIANSRAKSPVASFTKLSPSRTSTIRCGSPRRLAIDVAAIASVVATTAPNTKPSRQSKPLNTHRVVSATPSAVKPTSPNARSKMLTKLYLNSRQEVSQAAEYSNGGRTARKITSGSKAILGIPGTKLRSSPATTSTIGYGVCNFLASAAKTTTKSSSTRKTISTAWIPPLCITRSLSALDSQ